MRVLAAIIAVVMVTPLPTEGQTAGDSVRLRIPPSRDWRYGRLVSMDTSRLVVSHAESQHAYSLQEIGRAEIRTRKKVGVTVLGGILGGVAFMGGFILARPANRKPLFGSDGAALAVGVGCGVAGGLINVAVNPWYWKRTRFRARAAP